MNYLSDSEYESYGLESATPESFVAAASSLINVYCRRPTLAIMEFKERIRVVPGRNNVQLSNLPLAALPNQDTPLVSGRGRYAPPRRGEDTTMWELAEIALVYALPGTWVDLDVSTFDFFAETGEVSWLGNPLGLAFDEIELTYTAGFSQVPDPVKFACAQLVKNAQATPALNVRAGTVNSMHLEYFSDTLIDSTVQNMLAPYVAQKVG
jgi:hypothetical protein